MIRAFSIGPWHALSSGWQTHPYKLLDTADSSKVEKSVTAVLRLMNTGAQCGDRNVDPDPVAELEAVGDGFHRAVNANRHAVRLSRFTTPCVSASPEKRTIFRGSASTRGSLALCPMAIHT